MSRTIACPGCRQPVVWDGNPHRPFCSERCRLIDLGQWADEAYRIPVVSSAAEDLFAPSMDDDC